jgi:gamma-glutamyl:cysteine ligase YbdK (ATP-grasp superfamily)
MTIGTEHEYSLNNSHFHPLPLSDRVIEQISGRVQNETPLGEIVVSKELQKHVLEIIPKHPCETIGELERILQSGMNTLYSFLRPEYQLLGLGMHPLLTLDMTGVWDHEEKDFYQEYDRLFNLHQHGWLNIQALQINIPYTSEHELVTLYNRIRSLIPYLVAVSASSPFVEGEATGVMDNRLRYYRENQKEIPLICHNLIPEEITSVHQYTKIQEEICRCLREKGAELLCKEWVNSRGVIVRFSRCCVEVKAIDEQECLRSDMAITAFLLSLLRCKELPVETDHENLLALTEEAICQGVQSVRPELRRLYSLAERVATPDEKQYLPLIAKRIEKGSLAELLAARQKGKRGMDTMLKDLEYCLRQNIPYV